MSDVQKRLGGKITELRIRRRLTQGKLAEKTGMAVETVSRMERGVVMPSLKTLERVAEALDAELRDLFDFDPTPTRDSSFEREMGKVVAYLKSLSEKELVVVRKALPEVFKAVRQVY